MSHKIEINLVDYLNIRVVEELLTKELTMAKDTGKGTYRDLESARQHLERARGMYIALATLELIPVELTEAVGEDLTRIEQKITTTQRAKEAEAYARHMRGRS